MYNWRLSAFLVFSFMFWGVSMFSTSAVWLLLVSLGSNGGNRVKGERPDRTRIKEKSDDDPDDPFSEDSDTGPSNDPSQRRIKREEGEESHLESPFGEVAGSQTDSGTGTGLESAKARGVQRRRIHLFEGEQS